MRRGRFRVTSATALSVHATENARHQGLRDHRRHRDRSPRAEAGACLRRRGAVRCEGLTQPPPRRPGEACTSGHQGGVVPSPTPGQRDRHGYGHRDDQHADRDRAPVPPEMTAPVGHVVTATVQLHDERVEPPAYVADLGGELANPVVCAVVLDYASRSFAHCTSSFTVFRVTASGALTCRFQPTSASTAPITSKRPAIPSAASQPGIQAAIANTAATRIMPTLKTARTAATQSRVTVLSSAFRSALNSARASSTSLATKSETVSISRVSSWRVESD